jgi:hypothetical protein
MTTLTAGRAQARLASFVTTSRERMIEVWLFIWLAL